MRTLPSRRIIGFFLRFVVVYGALMALWPFVGDIYGELFQSGGEFVFQSFRSDGEVRFRPLTQTAGMDDTKMLVRTTGSPEWTFMNVSSWHMGYVSTVVLAGLVLATPIPLSRRGRALFWGITLLHGFIAIRLASLIAYAFTLDTPGPLVFSEAFWDRSLRAMIVCFAVGQGMSFIAPVLVWVLVSLRREDLAEILSERRR